MANEKPMNLDPKTGKRELLFTLCAMVAVFLTIVYFSTSFEINRPPGKLEARPAPDIEFTLPSGERAKLSNLKGKVVMLNFWASWCGPCIEEMPALRRLEHHFRDKGFLLLAFNLEDSQDDIQGKIDLGQYPRNLIFQFSKDALRPYDLRAIPVSVLVDSQGLVQDVYHGPRDWMDVAFLSKIETLLR